jgi:hypothetical protein
MEFTEIINDEILPESAVEILHDIQKLDSTSKEELKKSILNDSKKGRNGKELLTGFTAIAYFVLFH